MMPSFRYRALTQSGEIVSGSISAPSLAEVAHRIEYLGLVPIDTVEEGAGAVRRGDFALWSRPRAEDVTVFTRDLALLLKAGARINDALELLAQDIDIGRLRPAAAKIRASVLAGESFAEAISHHPALFPPMYVALVRVGEISGTLDQVLELLSQERMRSEAMRRKLTDAMQYPLFVLIAAICVMLFFILFVLPQFSSVLQDFGNKSDSALSFFFRLSDFLRANSTALLLTGAALVIALWLMLRRSNARAAIIGSAANLPGISRIVQFYRTSLF